MLLGYQTAGSGSRKVNLAFTADKIVQWESHGDREGAETAEFCKPTGMCRGRRDKEVGKGLKGYKRAGHV